MSRSNPDERRLPPRQTDEWRGGNRRSSGIAQPRRPRPIPEDSGRYGLRGREEQAKRICRECPVLAECRRHALAMPETHGIWGAMTPSERARGRAADRVAAAG